MVETHASNSLLLDLWVVNECTLQKILGVKPLTARIVGYAWSINPYKSYVFVLVLYVLSQ